jgi:hypothetical protein
VRWDGIREGAVNVAEIGMRQEMRGEREPASFGRVNNEKMAVRLL